MAKKVRLAAPLRSPRPQLSNACWIAGSQMESGQPVPQGGPPGSGRSQAASTPSWLRQRGCAARSQLGTPLWRDAPRTASYAVGSCGGLHLLEPGLAARVRRPAGIDAPKFSSAPKHAGQPAPRPAQTSNTHGFMPTMSSLRAQTTEPHARGRPAEACRYTRRLTGTGCLAARWDSRVRLYLHSESGQLVHK